MYVGTLRRCIEAMGGESETVEHSLITRSR